MITTKELFKTMNMILSYLNSNGILITSTTKVATFVVCWSPIFLLIGKSRRFVFQLEVGSGN